MSKLGFHIVYSTSEDMNYKASELNEHSSLSRGYMSKRMCNYPQDLVIEFEEGMCQFSQVQILSHEFAIASRIEVFTSTSPTFKGAEFQRLGYLSLSTNQESNYKARELKSVYINGQARFMKFSLQQNYVNNQNMYQQVGVIAVNVLGEGLRNNNTLDQGNHGRGSFNNGREGLKRDEYGTEEPTQIKPSPMDDLAFDMHFDKETSGKIRQVHAAKEQAVVSEDYDLAKQLKQLEENLKNIGLQIAKLEVEKRTAASQEDYDRAKNVKKEIQQLRDVMAQKIAQVPSLARNNNMDNSNHANFQQQQQLQPSSSPALSMAIEASGSRSTNQPPPSPQRQQHERQQHEYAAPENIHHQGAMEDQMDRPLPRSTSQQQQEEEEVGNFYPNQYQQQPTSINNNEDPILPREDYQTTPSSRVMLGESDETNPPPFPEDEQDGRNEVIQTNPHFRGIKDAEELEDPEPLPDGVVAEAQGLVALIGEYFTRCFYSSNWRHRDAVLQKVIMDLDTYPQDELTVFRECCKLIQGSLSDRIAQVLQTTIQLLEAMLERSHHLSQDKAGPLLSGIIKALVNKLGESNRVRDKLTATLFKMAHSSCVGPHYICSAILDGAPPKLNAPWKPLFGKVKLLEKLFHEFGLSRESGLSVKSIMGYLNTTNALGHQNNEIREACKKLVVALYGIVGSEVEPHLTKLRPKQLQEYQSAFENMTSSGESRPSSSGGRVSKPASSKPHASRKSSPRIIDDDENQNAIVMKQESTPMTEEDEDYDEDDLDNSVDEFTCQFCLKTDDSFTDDGLDMHYWSQCPMLTPCSLCEQVIEIACLNDHLLSECSMNGMNKECPRCGEAINEQYIEEHIARADCPIKLPKKEANRCPLCHEDIAPRASGWRAHLLDHECPRNPRSVT